MIASFRRRRCRRRPDCGCPGRGRPVAGRAVVAVEGPELRELAVAPVPCREHRAGVVAAAHHDARSPAVEIRHARPESDPRDCRSCRPRRRRSRGAGSSRPWPAPCRSRPRKPSETPARRARSLARCGGRHSDRRWLCPAHRRCRRPFCRRSRPCRRRRNHRR